MLSEETKQTIDLASRIGKAFEAERNATPHPDVIERVKQRLIIMYPELNLPQSKTK